MAALSSSPRITEAEVKKPLFPPMASNLTSGKKSQKDKIGDSPWKIIVVDDEQVVHDVTSMLLKGFVFENQHVDILDAYSGDEAIELLSEHPDTAVMLMDVVMETDDAGLRTVQKIRESLKNQYVRIILRTGQAGQAPEHEVINKYDINDYREKSDLTAQRLYTSLTTALRAYRDIKAIEELAESKESLESRVEERTRQIMEINEKLRAEVRDRIKANSEHEKSEKRLSEAQQVANIGSWEWELQNGNVSWSEQLYKILGIDPDEKTISPHKLIDFVPEAGKGSVKDALHEVMQNGKYDIEHEIQREDGEVRLVRQKGILHRNDKGEPIRVASIIHDITEKNQTEVQMRKLSSAIEQIADAVMITNVDGEIEYINQAFEDITGYKKDEIIGTFENLLSPVEQGHKYPFSLNENNSDDKVVSKVFINKKKNGDLYHEVKTITPLKNDKGQITHYISTGKDISEYMAVQQRLEHMAHHDALTKLPNRVLLQDRLCQLLARSKWNKKVIAVMFLDLDRFKVINDTLGHDAGDLLLQAVACRLQLCVREGDTVARLGGDEFAIILRDIAKKEDIDMVARKVLTSLKEPIHINNHELHITTSIGISLSPGDAKTVKALLKNADVAMYQAKSLGKNCYQFYSRADKDRAISRFKIEHSLRKAMDNDQFTLHYQPQIDLKEERLTGFEALLRCDNELLKGVSPAEFIPVLEDTGLIIPVGEWVLHQACLETKACQDKTGKPYCISVNLSIRQFMDKGLVRMIKKVLKKTELDPTCLELEVTEGLLIEQFNDTAAILREINALGVKLSIDDFGTGYSSLNYLKRLPFDTLKIDRSFVKDVDNNPDDAAITTAIITLGRTMDLQVIAEGVETYSQLNFLMEQKCDAIQGYLFSPPVGGKPLDEITADFEPELKKILKKVREMRDE